MSDGVLKMNHIIDKIKECGVVGAGGAGFPTHVKISGKAKTIVVNGAECEPLLRVDQQLMALKANEVVKGLEVVMEVAGAKEAVIALKGKYTNAIVALEKEIQGKSIKVHQLGDFYPAGDEHVTVYESTGELVPQGDIPLKVDCIVINVETLINVAKAVKGEPVINTYLTVTGEGGEPVTYRMPIGTAIKEVLQVAGYQLDDGMKVIEGGPMMGRVVGDLTDPITKATKGLIVLPAEHPLIARKTLSIEKIVRQSMSACIQCRYCTDLCPRYLLGHKLEPHKIMRSLKHFQGQEEIVKMAMSCSECGACEQYACVMGLSPRVVNATLKMELGSKGIKPNKASDDQAANRLHEHRKIPINRLISRIGLTDYDLAAPLDEKEHTVEQVHIMLRQHVGAPSEPVVGIGQKVERGQLIAKVPEGALGANIHASISGVIKDVSDRIVISSVEGSGEK